MEETSSNSSLNMKLLTIYFRMLRTLFWDKNHRPPSILLLCQQLITYCTLHMSCSSLFLLPCWENSLPYTGQSERGTASGAQVGFPLVLKMGPEFQPIVNENRTANQYSVGGGGREKGGGGIVVYRLTKFLLKTWSLYELCAFKVGQNNCPITNVIFKKLTIIPLDTCLLKKESFLLQSLGKFKLVENMVLRLHSSEVSYSIFTLHFHTVTAFLVVLGLQLQIAPAACSTMA